MRRYLYLLLAILAAGICCAQTSAFNKEAEIDQLRKELATVKTPQDSIPILYNIFDLTTRKYMPVVGKELFHTARRAGDHATQLDVIRLISNCYSKIELFERLEKETKALPKSKDRDETLLFLEMKKLQYDSRYRSDDQKKHIAQIIANLDRPASQRHSGNIAAESETHAQLIDLYTLVEYLRNESSGDMLKEYLDKLTALANKSEIELYSIPNIINTEAANIYSDVGDHKKAVDADRKLLKVIENLEEEYAKKGRKYRDYDVSRYIVYMRMLRNFEALSQEEIKDLHDKILTLASRSAEIKADMDASPKFYTYYYMATGDYNAAMPYLKKFLEAEKTPPLVRKQLLEYLILASERTGDVNTRLKALTRYNALLEELNANQSATKYKELQIKYDVESLKAENTELELKKRSEEIDSAKRIMTFVIVAFVLIGLVLILSLFNWGKFKRNSGRMGNIVDRMNGERRAIRNSIYYDYATDPDLLESEAADSGHSWHERMKRHHISQGDTSMFMTESIVNDLMYIASFGRETRKKYLGYTSVDSLLRQIGNRALEVADGQGTFLIEYPDDDFTIFTDPECLTAILGHILGVAVGSSPTGTVSLTTRESSEGSCEFVITIEGVHGASPNDPHMLDNFIRNNNILERKGSGLFICRMISLLLKTNHYPDTSYTDGARYIFSIFESPTK